MGNRLVLTVRVSGCRGLCIQPKRFRSIRCNTVYVSLRDRPSSPNTNTSGRSPSSGSTRTSGRSPVSLSTRTFRRSPPDTSRNLERLTQAYRY
ncbi:hypothetical protein [Thermoleptolyngbya sp. C42_A2020_037]|uniref:hypothetical protein n=1 Tax=Thermoleptolyngbya sp. C42_A2020_037 TaxID=2747799 RepID=UPI0019FC587D|nr:hypothetical protein [Thermoleptolyngbya sp. C42_A2020_037]MBF2085172.1 hypothetical protein [Thermoleptolyngbya sp. C42_A2020_037]